MSLLKIKTNQYLLSVAALMSSFAHGQYSLSPGIRQSCSVPIAGLLLPRPPLESYSSQNTEPEKSPPLAPRMGTASIPIEHWKAGLPKSSIPPEALPRSLREIEVWLKEATPESLHKVQERLHWDKSNTDYFAGLFRQYQSHSKKEAIKLFDPSAPASLESTSTVQAFVTAVAPADLLKKHLRVTEYADILKESSANRAAAKKVLLWIKMSQAGTGSSLERNEYVKRKLGRETLGAKGTDLMVELPPLAGKTQSSEVSLAELQFLQGLHAGLSGEYGAISLRDIVSAETSASLLALRNRPTVIDSSHTYQSYLEAHPDVFVPSDPSIQQLAPTLNEQGHLSFERVSPAGHGLMGIDAILPALDVAERPKKKGLSTIALIGNGEDPSGPSAELVGWMARTRTPIAMITTDKTPNDMKGGQIALFKNGDAIHAGIIEQAQAKAAGQQKLFEQLGLSIRNPGQKAYFNTNSVLVNYEALEPKLRALINKVGEPQFHDIISPDLIQNVKEQKGSDGSVKKFTQLEGAMGSVLLNLDKAYRREFGQPLVSFVNIDQQHRTEFFAPVKSAFDNWMLFHSDRFGLNPTNYRLIDKRPGFIPSVTLRDSVSHDKYWSNVDRVLQSFDQTKILNLDSLKINGRVNVSGLELKGRVEIEDQSNAKTAIDLKKLLKKSKVIENQKVIIGPDGKVTVELLAPQ